MFEMVGKIQFCAVSCYLQMCNRGKDKAITHKVVDSSIMCCTTSQADLI